MGPGDSSANACIDDLEDIKERADADARLIALSIAISDGIKLREPPLRVSGSDPTESKRFTREKVDGLTKLQRAYAAFYEAHGENGEALVASLLARSRERHEPDAQPDRELLQKAEEVSKLLLGSTRPFLELCDVRELQKEFSGSRPQVDDGWIRTASVVYSRTLGRASFSSGGHNLDAATTRIVRDSSLERGSIKLGENGTIVCNPQDAPMVEQLARLIARTENPNARVSAIEGKLRESPIELVRRQDEVLVTTGYPAGARGFSRENHLASAGAGNGRIPPPPDPPGALPSSEPPRGEVAGAFVGRT